MRARHTPHRTRHLAAWACMAAAMVGAIALARHDRVSFKTVAVASPKTVRLVDSPVRPPDTAELREAAGELEEAAEKARQATADLDRVKAELDDKQKTLEAVKAEADANAERTKRDLEDARAQLEARQADLETASREAAARVRAARRELERLHEKQIAQAASAGAVQADALGQRLPTAARLGPGRGPGASLPPFMPKDPSGVAVSSARFRSGVTLEQASRVAAAGAPRRLSPAELDPDTGEITWPSVLADARYAELTSAIEGPFRERAARGGRFDESEQARVGQAIESLVRRLRTNVTKHSSGKYGAARTFLDSLRAECDAVAAR